MNSTFLAAAETLQNGLIVFLIGAVLSGLIVPLRRRNFRKLSFATAVGGLTTSVVGALYSLIGIAGLVIA